MDEIHHKPYPFELTLTIKGFFTLCSDSTHFADGMNLHDIDDLSYISQNVLTLLQRSARPIWKYCAAEQGQEQYFVHDEVLLSTN